MAIVASRLAYARPQNGRMLETQSRWDVDDVHEVGQKAVDSMFTADNRETQNE